MIPGGDVHSMRVGSLWRYPVKSMQGEECAELIVDARGVRGDRRYGVFDVESETVISAKREGRLLQATASFTSEGLRVTMPDGHTMSPGAGLDDGLTNWLGHRVALAEAADIGPATFECPEDFEDDDSPRVRWVGVEGSFVDESALHLLTRADLELLSSERPDLHWEVRRFRPNIVVDTDVVSTVFARPGQRVELGDVQIEIQKGCSRCVMTTRPQPRDLERELDILRHVNRAHANEVGVRARVLRSGVIHPGDAVTVVM
ncbi:MAG TPA: MOSC N-terminal beta barrel domain-containing protein [Acidimicrobiales bacterium]